MEFYEHFYVMFVPKFFDLKHNLNHVAVDAPKEFRWRGSLPIPFLFTGEHKFVLEQVSPTITKLYHGEEFQGLLVPLLGGILKKTEQGFISMNEALKKRAEETTSWNWARNTL